MSNAASYTATSSPGSITATGATSPLSITGLTTDTAYTFTVKSNNPFGSSANSAASNSITPTAAAFDSIASFTVGAGGSSEINFTSIPSTYQSLQIRIMSLTTTSPGDGINARFNSDSGSNYSTHGIYGNQDGVGGFGAASDAINYFGFWNSSTYPIVSIIDIPNYANTNVYKTTKCMSGSDRNGQGIYYFFSGAWKNTSAITSIKIYPNSGTFAQGASFALYGIRGA